MAMRLLGKKLGMTQVFEDDGQLVPVTIISLGPNYVIQKKTEETDGYSALQLGFEPVKVNRAGKPKQGHFAKGGFAPMRHLKECRLSVEEIESHNVGDEIKADYFATGDSVDVTGTSRGRGFTGVVKRHGFAGTSSMTHGSHEVMRHGGSIGMSATPARVFKGKKMAGQHGNARTTVQNLRVVDVRADDNVILVKGAVPGAPDGLLLVQKSIKKG